MKIGCVLRMVLCMCLQGCIILSSFALLGLVVGAEDFSMEREGRLREPRGLGR